MESQLTPLKQDAAVQDAVEHVVNFSTYVVIAVKHVYDQQLHFGLSVS